LDSSVIMDMKPSSQKRIWKSTKAVRQFCMAHAMHPMDSGSSIWLPTQQQLHHISAMASTTMVEQMQFLHASLFSPAHLTLYKAIHNCHFATSLDSLSPTSTSTFLSLSPLPRAT
jgi:hypothetical protein